MTMYSQVGIGQVGVQSRAEVYDFNGPAYAEGAFRFVYRGRCVGEDPYSSFWALQRLRGQNW